MAGPEPTDGADLPEGPPVVDLHGTLFVDLVMADLPGLPRAGEEVRTTSMAWAPGGVATMALGLARLGARPRIGCDVGDDEPGQQALSILVEEGVDVTGVRVHPGWTTPLTVSLAHDGDRRMITYERPAPVTADRGGPPLGPDGQGRAPAAVLVDLDPRADPDACAQWPAGPLGGPGAEGGAPLVLGDLGWDDTGAWNLADLPLLERCDVITPNAVEAVALTGAAGVEEAAARLAERVATVVVTDGPRGVWAVDPEHPRGFRVPAVPAPRVLDATGAGDALDAALLWSLAQGWPLRRGLDLACLCASLAVGCLTGSLATPGWYEIARWWRRTGSADPGLSHRFAFLADELAAHPARPARRPGPRLTTAPTAANTSDRSHDEENQR